MAGHRATPPLAVGDRVKGILTAALTPLSFTVTSGHWRSALLRRVVGPQGAILPWYTYPATAYLSSLDLAGCEVLEFGAGQSTLWWAGRVRSVLAVEGDPRWYGYVTALVDGTGNVTVSLEQDPAKYPQLLSGHSFDIVVVDGGDRLRAATAGAAALRPGGLLVLDDSEGYWGEAGRYPILDLLRDRGLSRIDFAGYAPAVAHPRCTSVFFSCSATTARLLELPPPARQSLLGPAPWATPNARGTRYRGAEP